MSKSLDHVSEETFSALTLDNIEDISYFYSFDYDQPGYDEQLLSKHQVDGSNIYELKDLFYDYGIPEYKVILCKLENMKGCVNLEGDVSWPLIFLDPTKAENLDDLKKTYIHEAAHLFSDGSDHDLMFSIANNSFLLMSGYEFSVRDYDYRACEICDISTDEAKNISKEISRLIVESHLNVDTKLEIIKLCKMLTYQTYVDSDKKESSYIEYFEKRILSYFR